MAASSPSSTERSRARVLRRIGGSPTAIKELLEYGRSPFDFSSAPAFDRLPLDDEPFVDDWERYAQKAQVGGTAADALAKCFVELHFPVRDGVSQTEEYLTATRNVRQTWPDSAEPEFSFDCPEEVSIILHPTLAGRIPVIRVGARRDFERLVQAVTCSNEPEPVPPTIGAMMISGYTNWERIDRLKQRWRRAHPNAAEWKWKKTFRDVPSSRYQDRFILCSSGYYSNVPPNVLNLDPSTWRTLSIKIRTAHEAAHYVSRRLFGAMQNSLLDEMIADYAGLVNACGSYRADWFLHFMGLSESVDWEEGRIHNYRGDPPLSDEAFSVLRQLVETAARNLQKADALLEEDGSIVRRPHVLLALHDLTLEDIASRRGTQLLYDVARNLAKNS